MFPRIAVTSWIAHPNIVTRIGQYVRLINKKIKINKFECEIRTIRLSISELTKKISWAINNVVITVHDKYRNTISPSELFVGFISQTWLLAIRPCCKNTGLDLTVLLFSKGLFRPNGILWSSRMYPSCVTVWWTSSGYPRLRIISA